MLIDAAGNIVASSARFAQSAQWPPQKEKGRAVAPRAARE
jgi:hypothetical protein